MAILELTPEQRQIVLGSSGPVEVLFPETQEQYVIIPRQALDRVQNGVLQQLQSLVSAESPRESLEYTYYDFRDTPDEP